MKTFTFSSQDLHSKTNAEIVNEIKNVKKAGNSFCACDGRGTVCFYHQEEARKYREIYNTEL